MNRYHARHDRRPLRTSFCSGRSLRRVLRFALMILAASCVKVPPKRPAPAPPPPPPPVGDLDISGAAKVLAVDLGSQVGAGTTERIVVVDPVLDRVTGQQTVLSAQLDSAITSAIATSVKGAKVLPFNAESAKNARFVLTASVAPTDSANRYTVSASLTDQPTGLIVAQSAARFVMSNADRSPTRFYNDSPSLVRDRSVEGYLRTSELKKGSPADALYVSQIPTSGLLAQATAAYDAGRWEEALTAYEAASARSDGQQLRTFNGLYLSNIRLNRTAAATAAFGKIAALGLATDNLAVKLLFKPGSSSDWWPDFAGVYPMWVRQIARAAQQTKSCLEVVGHTSRSGTEAVNNKLSVARAETVRRMMLAEANTLARRLRASGVGFRENIVGTGADNASDAIDRRVEFKIEACQP